MNLTEHFTLEELTFSEKAVRLGISNAPDAQVLANLRRLALALEKVRELVGAPIRVSSGYRCLAVNRAIGSGDTSAHVKGLAADFTCPRMTPYELAKKIRDAQFDFVDQVIYEGAWVHLGLSNGAPRNQSLTAVFAPGKKTRYLPGITLPA